MARINLAHSGIQLTTRCTLRCKLCGACTPYYDKRYDIAYDELAKCIDCHFAIVDECGDFTLSGGESFLYNELDRVILKTLEYANQIKRILVLTNGTLIPNNSVISVLANHSDKCYVTISDYGEQLSKNAAKLTRLLADNNIPTRVINYHGDDVFFGGWVNYLDYSLRGYTKEERDNRAEKCARNHCFFALDGEFHRCFPSYWRQRIGIIGKDKETYVDLLDTEEGIEIKRERLLRILNNKSCEACDYCPGLSGDVPRYPPAEQI